jgi:hypothetical protein
LFLNIAADIQLNQPFSHAELVSLLSGKSRIDIRKHLIRPQKGLFYCLFKSKPPQKRKVVPIFKNRLSGKKVTKTSIFLAFDRL